MRKNNEIMKAIIFWIAVIGFIMFVLWNTPEMYR